LKGHEIASHTMTHPYLNSLTLDQQKTELRDSLDTINANVVCQKCLTLAYPYCVVGDANLCTTYYTAARGCQGSVESSTPADMMNISSIICGNTGSFQSAGSLNGQCDAAAASGGWCVFLIHGIDNDGGYSPLASTELRGCLQYLDSKRNKVWVQTFGNVVRYIRERNAASVTELSNDANGIAAQVTHPLDNTIYNSPLTIRRVLPADWFGARTVQKGKVLPVQVQVATGRGIVRYVLFDAVPNGGDILLTRAPAPPAGLTAIGGDALILLDWSDNTESDLAGYNVYRSTISGKNYAKLNDSILSSSNYTDPNAVAGTPYYYVVTAVDSSSGESGYSNEVSAVIHSPDKGSSAR
jgi:hypothetical protein